MIVMFQTNFAMLFAFYVSYSWFTAISKSVLPTHLLNQNLNLQQMIFGMFLGFIGQLLLLLAVKNLTSKLSWRLALICNALYVLLVVSVQNNFQFYLASFINGMVLFFFFVFYNIAHFKNTAQDKIGHSSALMFVIPSVVGIIATFLAGYFAQLNITILWILSLLSFITPFYLINLQTDFKISFNVKASLKEIGATRVFLFLEGVWEALPFAIIPIYTLYFIKTPLTYGAFLSYLGIVSVVANLTLGRLSDRLQKRIIFLYPLTIVMAVTSLLFTQVRSDLQTWIIVVSIIQFLLPLFWSVSTAMVIDTHSNLELAIPGRELTLTIGRSLGVLIVFLSFLIEKTPFYIFVFLSIVLFLYPIMLFRNTKISKKYSYL